MKWYQIYSHLNKLKAKGARKGYIETVFTAMLKKYKSFLTDADIYELHVSVIELTK